MNGAPSENRALSGAIPPGHNGPGSDGNKEVLCISQGSRITRASPSDCLVSYPGHSFVGFYLFAEMQSVYSTVPADLAMHLVSLQSWTSEECGVPLHCHYSQVHSGPEW